MPPPSFHGYNMKHCRGEGEWDKIGEITEHSMSDTFLSVPTLTSFLYTSHEYRGKKI